MLYHHWTWILDTMLQDLVFVLLGFILLWFKPSLILLLVLPFGVEIFNLWHGVLEEYNFYFFSYFLIISFNTKTELRVFLKETLETG